MGFFESIKKSLSMSEEEYLDDVDVQEEEEEYVPRKRHTASRAKQYDAPADNVVDFKASPAAPASGSKAHVVFKKVDSFADVGPVADVLNEKRIAILNLETCPTEEAVRVIDFLSGVAYANNATIQRVAGRAYIITPNNVPLSGELLDEVVNSATHGLF
ncbi:MAG: cell division protein SepF [Clostridia bacterium]|nr:cell division protein SepF [Clostridia bacterium]